MIFSAPHESAHSSQNRRRRWRAGGDESVWRLPVSASEAKPGLETVDSLARRFYVSLDDEQRRETCVNYDHPLRQYHNRGVWGGGRDVLAGFNRAQRSMLTDLMHAGLSADGRRRIPEEALASWTGVNGMRVLMYADRRPAYQLILTGVHLNLRLGEKAAKAPRSEDLGDQRGNERTGLTETELRAAGMDLRRKFLHPPERPRRVLSRHRAAVPGGI